MLGKVVGHKLDRHIVKLVEPMGLSPNCYTMLGMIFNIMGASLLATGRFKVAGLFIIAGGTFDLFDGAIAREIGKHSSFGAFLDSVFDRYSDTAIFIGFIIFYATERDVTTVIITSIALMGAILTSYTRARAESLIKKNCNVGLIERSERIILIIMGIFFNIIPVVMLLLIVLGHSTVFYRIYYTWKEMNKSELSIVDKGEAELLKISDKPTN